MEGEAGWVSCPRCSRRARRGQVYCELCGERLHAPAAAVPAAARRGLRCEGCGAAVAVPEGERTTVCPFCGVSQVALGETAPDRFAPEFVLPFSVGRKEAEAKFNSWLGRSGFFTPGDFRHAGKLAALRGVYIPFWSFSMRSESDWQARIGEYWWETVVETYTTVVGGKTVTKTRTRRIQHTEWYPLAGRFHQFHSYYLISGSRGLPQDIVEPIWPFPVEEVVRYAPHFLAGWLCEEYSVDREQAARISEREFREREARDIAAFLPGDCHADLQTATTFHDQSEDLILVPIWVFAYAYRARTYRFLVNGATGKCDGKKPFSTARLLSVILAGVAFVAALALAAYLLSGW